MLIKCSSKDVINDDHLTLFRMCNETMVLPIWWKLSDEEESYCVVNRLVPIAGVLGPVIKTVFSVVSILILRRPPGTLPFSVSRHCNSFENQVPVDFI